MNDPSQMALDIIELRAYARTKEQIDRARDAKDMPEGPMVEAVFEVQHELLRRHKEAAK